jgi:PilZ domain
MTVFQSRAGDVELRKIARKSLFGSKQQRASIDLGDGSPLHNCMICDVSQQGARVAVVRQSDIPDEFKLMLGGGGAHRRCRVVWRTEQQVGIAFLKEPQNAVAAEDIHERES